MTTTAPDQDIFQGGNDEEEQEMIMLTTEGTEGSIKLKQIWHPAFVIFAFVIAFLSSYAAVHLLDHHLWFWRSEELKKSAILKHPEIYAACMLAVGTVWCMHFVGMSAVTLEDTPICYDWSITVGSLAAVLALMIAGIKLAGKDVFATPDRDQILDQILRDKFISKSNTQDYERQMFYVTAGHKLQYLTMGSFLAASGAVVMHYTGMMAQSGPFHREWNIWLIAASILTAIAICFVGFWIIFRLRWKIEQLWLRYASAAVIAVAVCGLHFFGMVSVTYYADSGDTDDTCHKSTEASPNAWTSHQIIVFAIFTVVLAISFMVESAINHELLVAYEGAAKSTEIVSSLFPAQVRDRLMANGKRRVQSFLTSGNTDDNDDSHTGHSPQYESEDLEAQSDPIADLFPNTTILFMDLEGFTKWSSSREPAQVFILLETLYQACDRIAARRKVFKIETIGDCYVAATGLPNPQKDHAVRMAKFASDCQSKISQLLSGKLQDKLGQDIKDLGFRAGLHSGPITGGVLRGEKARFQLFGDTMNTASRMESNGVKGRIHVSEETANELIAQGKNHWITPREEMIEVKGKSRMQTYFVSVAEVAGSKSSKTDEAKSCVSGNSCNDVLKLGA